MTSLVQLEYSGFDGATVPICTFTLSKAHISEFTGSYIRLSDFRGSDQQGPKALEAIQNPNCGWFVLGHKGPGIHAEEKILDNCLRPEFFTNQYGLIVDYLAEYLREMRKWNFADAIDKWFKLGNNLNQRDTIAVRRTVSGLLKLIYVPNALFTNIIVENPSRMTNRRIKETIGLRYQDIGKMAAIVADVKAMLLAHPEIDAESTLIVSFNAFGDFSLDIFIYAFAKTTEWEPYHRVKQDALLKIADIIAAHGAGIAFPTRSLHIEPSPAPCRIAPPTLRACARSECLGGRVGERVLCSSSRFLLHAGTS